MQSGANPGKEETEETSSLALAVARGINNPLVRVSNLMRPADAAATVHQMEANEPEKSALDFSGKGEQAVLNSGLGIAPGAWAGPGSFVSSAFFSLDLSSKENKRKNDESAQSHKEIQEAALKILGAKLAKESAELSKSLAMPGLRLFSSRAQPRQSNVSMVQLQEALENLEKENPHPFSTLKNT